MRADDFGADRDHLDAREPLAEDGALEAAVDDCELRLGSSLLSTAQATYVRLFGTDPELAVVHGGLECAVLGQKLPGVEMVSIGPEIVGLHAPGEKVRVSSTQRFYRLLGALLDDLSS